MNAKLQPVMNRAIGQPPVSGRLPVGFRQYDRVVQLRNNYECDVYNGDLGVVMEVDERERRVKVRKRQEGGDLDRGR